jgi:voltage-gated potassium channel
MRLRARYNAFVDRHEVAWELAFAALAIFYVALAVVPDGTPWVLPLEWAITVVFAVEFVTRLWAAPSRRAYLRGHWIDVVALVPPARWLRTLRLLRLLRLVRAFAGIARAAASAERMATHRGLVWLLAAWVGVMVITAMGLYEAEKGMNPAIQSPTDAVWWGIATMTTVGYGDVVPLTPEGRLFASALMILGIGLFAAVTATITSFFVADDAGGDVPSQLEKLANLHAAGSLTDEEFSAAKAALLGRP